MIEFVIDASALLEVVLGEKPDAALRRTTLTAQGAAPELIDLESANTIRALVCRDALAADDGRAALSDIRDTPIARMTHRPLLERIWELRHSLTAYDASYVALAERLDVPLLTCDGRLARAHGHHAHIELFPGT